jgi:hypothetical protein
MSLRAKKRREVWVGLLGPNAAWSLKRLAAVRSRWAFA